MARRHYKSKKVRLACLLERWVISAIKNRTWQSGYDIHIDEMGGFFKRKSNWIKYSGLILELLTTLTAKHSFTTMLVISTVYNQKDFRPDVPFEAIDLNSLQAVFNSNDFMISPPSYYIFPKGYEIFAVGAPKRYVHPRLSMEIGHNVFYAIDTDEQNFRQILYYVLATPK